MRTRVSRNRIRIGFIGLLIFFLTACGLQLPVDPHGTLDRVRGGVMRVGVTENRPWVKVDAAEEPSGIEPTLISGFADQLDSDIEWTTGSEAVLLEELDQGELDIVVGGFLDDTPWIEKGAITVPYREQRTSSSREKHVMIVRMGENGLLLALEKFLLEKVGT